MVQKKSGKSFGFLFFYLDTRGLNAEEKKILQEVKQKLQLVFEKEYNKKILENMMNDEFIETILVNRLKFLVLEKEHSYNYEDIILKCKRTVTHRLKKNETIMMPNIDRLLKNMNFKELKTLLNKDSFKNEIINKYEFINEAYEWHLNEEQNLLLFDETCEELYEHVSSKINTLLENMLNIINDVDVQKLVDNNIIENNEEYDIPKGKKNDQEEDDNECRIREVLEEIDFQVDEEPMECIKRMKFKEAFNVHFEADNSKIYQLNVMPVFVTYRIKEQIECLQPKEKDEFKSIKFINKNKLKNETNNKMIYNIINMFYNNFLQSHSFKNNS